MLRTHRDRRHEVTDTETNVLDIVLQTVILRLLNNSQNLEEFKFQSILQYTVSSFMRTHCGSYLPYCWNPKVRTISGPHNHTVIQNPSERTSRLSFFGLETPLGNLITRQTCGVFVSPSGSFPGIPFTMITSCEF